MSMFVQGALTRNGGPLQMRTIELGEDFWSKVVQPGADPIESCWEWQAAKTPDRHEARKAAA